MPTKIIVEDKLVTAYLMGEIDHHSARGMREEIDAAVERAVPELLIMDFSDVSFMDSSGIGLVLGRYRQMQSLDGSLHLQNLGGQLYKVMRLAGIDRLVEIERGKAGKIYENHQ